MENIKSPEIHPKWAMKRKKRKKHSGLFWKAVLVCVLAFFAAAIILFIDFFKTNEWHEFNSDLILGADKSTLIYGGDGEIVSVIAGGENRIPVEIEGLPEHVKYAFVSAEDARFFEHKGVDIVRIVGAAWADIKAGSAVQGASTIGQQLIKLSHLTAEKTFERKLEEAYLSICMEHEFDKEEILEMYMNYVYFGGGFYGIETASLGYFGVHANELSIAQAAQLAGILKAPSDYAPHLDMEKSVRRRNAILGLMHEYGYISKDEYKAATEEDCILNNAIPSQRSYYIDVAIDEACGILGMERNEFLKKGYSVYTALDGEADKICAELLNDKANFPDGSPDSVQAAMVLLENDGSIVAICGGRGEYIPLSFNRATDMERQPGSLIKPILCYAPAIEMYGYTAATVLDDSPTDFFGYMPRNPGGEYSGRVTLRTALAKSLNIPAVSVLADIGIENGIRFTERLGISFEGEDKNLALALGGFTHGVSPLEMAGAYVALSNGGFYTKPYSVKSIEYCGEVLYSHEDRLEAALSENTAFIITNMLQDAATVGTAGVLREMNMEIAAKTGTSLDDQDRVRDAWAAAYTVDYTAIMWMGMDSAEQGSLPKGTTGGNSACTILGKLYERIYGEEKPNAFPIPEDIQRCSLDAEELMKGQTVLATQYTPEENVIDEYFSSMTAPVEISSFWQYPTPPSRVSWYQDYDGHPVICFTADERYSYIIIRESEDGTEFQIAEIHGKAGQIEYCDVSALPPDTPLGVNTYIYTVRTVHPQIAVDGRNAVSVDSRKMRVLLRSNTRA